MVIEDKDLGEIKLVENIRARRIIVKKRGDSLQLTYPKGVSLSYIRKVVDKMKPRLLKFVEKKQDKIIFSPQSVFKTFSFVLSISESDLTNNYYLSLKEGVLSISCPTNTDYEDNEVQNKIREMIESALRYEAKRIFPSKVEQLATQFNFEVSGVKINKSRTRWGSCNTKKSINLSYFCMLLPEYLVDFIILHELCHTKEMNHGERFWSLLDSITQGKSKELTKELKSFKINW